MLTVVTMATVCHMTMATTTNVNVTSDTLAKNVCQMLMIVRPGHVRMGQAVVMELMITAVPVHEMELGVSLAGSSTQEMF